MAKQIISKEFLKMQKLAGLLNEDLESFVWDDIKDDYLKPKQKFKFNEGKVKLFSDGTIIISDKSDSYGGGDEVEFTKQGAKDLLRILKQIME